MWGIRKSQGFPSLLLLSSAPNTTYKNENWLEEGSLLREYQLKTGIRTGRPVYTQELLFSILEWALQFPPAVQD